MNVQPYEAHHLPEVPPEYDDTMRDLVTAVNGFVYAGDRLEAVVATVRWLRANPQAAAALGLTERVEDASCYDGRSLRFAIGDELNQDRNGIDVHDLARRIARHIWPGRS